MKLYKFKGFLQDWHISGYYSITMDLGKAGNIFRELQEKEMKSDYRKKDRALLYWITVLIALVGILATIFTWQIISTSGAS